MSFGLYANAQAQQNNSHPSFDIGCGILPKVCMSNGSGNGSGGRAQSQSHGYSIVMRAAGTNRFYWSKRSYRSPSSARESARQACGKENSAEKCEELMLLQDQCLAIATNRTHFAIYYGNSTEQAEKHALRSCNDANTASAKSSPASVTIPSESRGKQGALAPHFRTQH